MRKMCLKYVKSNMTVSFAIAAGKGDCKVEHGVSRNVAQFCAKRHAKLRVSRNEFRKMRILVFEISFACMHSGSIFVFKLDLQENA